METYKRTYDGCERARSKLGGYQPCARNVNKTKGTGSSSPPNKP